MPAYARQIKQGIGKLKILAKLFGNQSQRIESAMSRTAERQALLTKNLANVNVPGYKRQDMDFSIVLKESSNLLPMRATDERHIGFQNSPLQQQSEVERDGRSIREDGNSVDLETEVAALTETSLHYSTLSLMARRYFDGLKSVIKEGR